MNQNSDVRSGTNKAVISVATAILLFAGASLSLPTTAAHDHGGNNGASQMNEKKQPEVPESVAHVEHIRQPSARHFTGGQPDRDDFDAFAELGVETVINMRSLAEMSDIPQAAWVTEAEQAYYHIPIAGTDDINRENVALFHQVMERESQNTLYMHCASSNRVGAMMALRAAWHQGASAEEALAIGEQYGMTSLRAHVESQLNQ